MSPAKHDHYDIGAERAVLACCLNHTKAAQALTDLLGVRDFFDYRHKIIFGAIIDLVELGQHVDAATVTTWLEKECGMTSAGGITYLQSIAQTVPPVANALFYAAIVKDRAASRRATTPADEQIVDAEVQPSASEQVARIVESLEQQLARAHKRNAERQKDLDRLKMDLHSATSQRDFYRGARDQLITERDELQERLGRDFPCCDQPPKDERPKRYSFSQQGLGPCHGAVFPDGTVHTNTDLVHGPVMTPPAPADSPIQVRGFRERPLRTPVTAVWKGSAWSFTPSIPTNGGRVDASDTGITNWVALTPDEGEAIC